MKYKGIEIEIVRGEAIFKKNGFTEKIGKGEVLIAIEVNGKEFGGIFRLEHEDFGITLTKKKIDFLVNYFDNSNESTKRRK